jgi:hypothetical protein
VSVPAHQERGDDPDNPHENHMTFQHCNVPLGQQIGDFLVHATHARLPGIMNTYGTIVKYRCGLCNKRYFFLARNSSIFL